MISVRLHIGMNEGAVNFKLTIFKNLDDFKLKEEFVTKKYIAEISS